MKKEEGTTEDDLETRLQDAIAIHRCGNAAAAEPVYRAVLAVDPDHAEARHMMGVIHMQQGRLAEAEKELRRALARDGGVARYHNTLGYVLVQQGRHGDALAAYDAALACDPHFTDAAYNKGTLLLSLGRREESERMFRTALERGANEAEVFNNLAAVLIKLNRIREAVACCRDGLSCHPGDPMLATTMASALELSNDLAAAEDAIRTVCGSASAPPLARVILARVLRRLGRLDDALDTIEAAFGAPLEREDEAEACFEKGLIQDARGVYAEAFTLFERSNVLQAKEPEASRMDGDRYLAEIRAYRNWMERKAPVQQQAARGRTTAPVFFVGFPRSGTTLMEQMLKAHPDIVTTEEASPLFLVKMHAIKLAERSNLAYPSCFDAWDDEILDELRSLFSRAAEETVGKNEGRVLVDKLPLNIVELGLVARLWPDARVLVALRDPRDACLSCFIQRFSFNDAMVNFLDLERTATLYAEAMGLWGLYRDRLGLSFLEYRYEDLVADFEGVVRRVLEFVGVGWCDAVAGYREAMEKRIIRTPSYRDVVVPLNDRAVQRWRKYEAQLAPILPRLAPFAKQWGYEP